MKALLFWIALPLMLPQAIALRRTAPRFAAADGPTHGSIGSGRDVRLLAIGDSIVAGVGARRLSRALVGQTAVALSENHDVRVHWDAIGKTGMTARRFLETCMLSLPQDPPDYVVISLGVNDVASLRGLGQWQRDLRTLFDQLGERYPDALVLFAGMPPLRGFPLLPEPLRRWIGMRGDAFDAASKAEAAAYRNVRHVPIDFEPDASSFADDGFHPSEASYRVFGQAMAAEISRSQPPPSGTCPDSSRSSA